MLMNQSLLDEFSRAVSGLDVQADSFIVESVHKVLMHKIYNARCNEFLRTISKLACIDKDKVIDGNVSLRDELKVYALKKLSCS